MLYFNNLTDWIWILKIIGDFYNKADIYFIKVKTFLIYFKQVWVQYKFIGITKLFKMIFYKNNKI